MSEVRLVVRDRELIAVWMPKYVLALIATALLARTLHAQPPEPPLKQTRISGIVVDEAGAPARGIEVLRLYRDMPATTRTDDEGRFAIEVPREARSERTLVAQDASGKQQGYFRFADGPVSAETSPRIVLRKSREVAVKVMGTDQRPIPGVIVTVTSNYWPIRERRTDVQGAAVIDVPADAPLDSVFAYQPDVGLDYLLYRKAGELASDPYRLSQDHHGPLTLTLSGTRTLTVRVVDETGRPLPEAKVIPWYIECPRKGGFFQIGRFAQETDQAGSAEFRIIPASNTAIISIRAVLKDHDLLQRWEFDPAKPVNELTGTMIRLVPISGTVADAQGRPVAEATVSVVGDGHQSEGFRGTATSGADGTFRILVKPNHYYVLGAAHEKSASPIKRLILRANQGPDPIDLVLQAATRIHGKLTSSTDGKPLVGRFVSIRSDDGLYYYKLPKDQQLPNPLDDRASLSAYLHQSMQSGPQGEFEFLVGPGNYAVSSQVDLKGVKIESKGELDLRVDLRATDTKSIPLVGRVVGANDPERGVAEVTVTGFSTQPFPFPRISAVSDDAGKFQFLRSPADMYLHAKTSNGVLAGMVKVAADTREVAIPIGPLASAQGRLVDEATGLPLPGQQMEFGFRIEMKTGGWTTQFGGTATTDERGEFTIIGLVPGYPFELRVVVDVGPDGRPRSWRPVSTVTAKKAELVKLGDVKLPSPK